MSKQTAVEWLENELKKLPHVNVIEVFQKAKAMEKRQVSKAFQMGQADGYTQGLLYDTPRLVTRLYKDGEDYYNQTYGGDK
jgi:hypothetical protein